ncbi:taurine transport system ATP-binding protein [Kitasatospora sp. SolWspMP-SS2h]|uniref:ABC transporter ATP-binding protein n=1 Tax=Kitasatospora sp. SolWspMP-SS2h TaxID=1305729 RepID=UPI000DBAA2C5|nr:ABC transporter ATP-binding protein [Kitasatospora sp. SolWspMP-SS2h]RAJ35799.1 taurine transport system ATP-binding protein [Kitasatospora sp. SolWspMP-SS2h]
MRKAGEADEAGEAVEAVEVAERASPAVALDRITVRYGGTRGRRRAGREVTAVHDVSLTVAEGEFVVLVGPSGCGKTTLLRVVAGFEPAVEGGALVHGAPPRPGRGTGLVFQQPRLFPWRTVGGNLAFVLARHGLPRAERAARTAELLDLVGLSGYAGRRTWELSGGQQQRVAIARALAGRPRLLLLDEPFAALDALTRERLQEELRTLTARAGTAVLFVTHSVDEAVLLGSRVLVMAADPGRVVADLPVDLPRDSATDPAALRGTPAFAHLRGTLSRTLREAAGAA